MVPGSCSKTTEIRTAKFRNYQKESASPMNRDLPQKFLNSPLWLNSTDMHTILTIINPILR